MLVPPKPKKPVPRPEELMGRYCKLQLCPRFFVTADWGKEYCSETCKYLDETYNQAVDRKGDKS